MPFISSRRDIRGWHRCFGRNQLTRSRQIIHRRNLHLYDLR
jgi:hypothetical protein